MTNLRAAQEIARATADTVVEVEAVYFIGSRALDRCRPDSDFDLLAIVTNYLENLSPGWASSGVAPAPGFVAEYHGIPVHWWVVSIADLEKIYLAPPAHPVYQRAA